MATDRHTLLFLNSKAIPPFLKIRSDDDLGGHARSIPYKDYSVKGLYLSLVDSRTSDPLVEEAADLS
jgi:hypothetical protein